MAKVEIIREYWDNGQLEYEIPYVNGKQHGIAKWWHPNGQLRWETTYINGRQHGSAQWWYENGDVNFASIWNKDRLRFILKYPRNTNIKQVSKFTHEQWRKLK